MGDRTEGTTAYRAHIPLEETDHKQEKSMKRAQEHSAPRKQNSTEDGEGRHRGCPELGQPGSIETTAPASSPEAREGASHRATGMGGGDVSSKQREQPCKGREEQSAPESQGLLGHVLAFPL